MEDFQTKVTSQKKHSSLQVIMGTKLHDVLKNIWHLY